MIGITDYISNSASAPIKFAKEHPLFTAVSLLLISVLATRYLNSSEFLPPSDDLPSSDRLLKCNQFDYIPIE